MKNMKGQVDKNDLAYVIERYGLPVAGIPCPIKNGEIHPNMTRFLMSDGRIVEVFHVKPVYYLHQNGEWRPMSEITSYHGNHRIDLLPDWDKKIDMGFLAWLLKRTDLIGGRMNIPSTFGKLMPVSLFPIGDGAQILFTTSTFYPDPHVETATVDGQVMADIGNPGAVYATFRANAGNSHDDTSATFSPWGYQSGTTANQFIYEARGIILFDTSAISDTDTISAATFSLYGQSSSLAGNANWSATEREICLVSSNPASNTDLVNGDHAIAGFGSTLFASRYASASWSTAGYNDFVLNASGIAAVSKTGITKLGTLFGATFDNADPGDGDDNAYKHVTAYSADQTGTSNDPKLVVEHAAAASGVHLLTMLGVGN